MGGPAVSPFVVSTAAAVPVGIHDRNPIWTWSPACGVCGVAALLDGRAFFVELGVVVVGVIIQPDRLSNNMKLTLQCIYRF